MTKRLEIKPFLNPETMGFNLLLPAVRLPQHDASAEKDPPAGLSSIRSPILDRV